MIINQISVFLENRAGQLSEITGILADNNIDLMAINIAETEDYGILRLITMQCDEAKKILKDNGFVVSAAPVVLTTVPNEVGGLNKLLKVLTDNNVDIEYMYSINSNKSDKAAVVIKTADCENTEKVLEN